MAYTAYLNGTIFFDTDTEDNSLALTSASVKLKAGSAGDFTFVIPPQNSAYGNFHRLVDYVDVYDDSRLIFSGRVYSVSVIFDTQQKVECEGLLAVLNDTIFRPATYTGYLHDLVSEILSRHNSQVSSDKQLQVGNLTITNYHVEEKEYKNYDSSLSRIKDLVDAYGGQVYVRKVSNTLYFDWLEEFEGYTNQKIILGENLLDLTKKQDSSDIVTVLIPTGASQDDGSKLTISSVNGGLDYITAEQSLITEFGTIYGSKEWTDITTPADLKTRATKWLDINSQPKYSVRIKAIDLANAGYNVTSFTVGQYIQVISVPHGLIDTITDESSTVDIGIVDEAVVDIGGVAYWFEVNELNLNLLDVSQNYLQLGKDVAGYVGSMARTTSTIVNQMEALSQAYATKSLMEQEVIRATDLITGNMGGYVVIHDSDNDGYPDEILIMDSPDINSAVNVWRWNKNGLGYSSTGYSGSYGTAITADGRIVADFITAGTLSGDRVRAGRIESVNGNTYWDLNAGALNFNNTFTVDAQGNVVANSLNSTNANITGGSIQMETAQDDETFIRLKGNGVTSTLSPSQLLTYTNDYTTLPYGSNMGQFHSSGVTLWNYDNIIGNFTVQNLLSGLQCQFYMMNKSGSTVKQGLMINSSYDSGATITMYPKGTDSYGRIVLSTNDGTIKLYNTSNTNTVTINRTGNITCVSLTQTSDENAKNSIKELDKQKSAEFIYSLKPVSFRYNDVQDGTHHGVTTQDVEKQIKRVYGDSDWAVVNDPSNPEMKYKSLAYTELISDMIATIQSQNERITAMEKLIKEKN